ncbi:hypothetical protein N3K66_007908 [Trichothecium roseum]|uniref:Uncharacterized protein n=1 Tax=Trichothecium roseum TaxID=47278 RepID=A0ACC0US25_9HYPO|nr:hypothetical protein N3K66_007908 [Trichothecium roseum]
MQVTSTLVYRRPHELKKGQFIAVPSHSRTINRDIFEYPTKYDGLRLYGQGLDEHRARPFKDIDGDFLIWSAGRLAYPGRFIANILVKIMLVKLLNEYDFAFVNGRRPPNFSLHEFVMFHPENRILIRRRGDVTAMVRH